jgi:hypothetical protein
MSGSHIASDLCYRSLFRSYLADPLHRPYCFLWGELPHGLAQKYTSCVSRWLVGLDAVSRCGGALICKPNLLLTSINIKVLYRDCVCRFLTVSFGAFLDCKGSRYISSFQFCTSTRAIRFFLKGYAKKKGHCQKRVLAKSALQPHWKRCPRPAAHLEQRVLWIPRCLTQMVHYLNHLPKSSSRSLSWTRPSPQDGLDCDVDQTWL